MVSSIGWRTQYTNNGTTTTTTHCDHSYNTRHNHSHNHNHRHETDTLTLRTLIGKQTGEIQFHLRAIMAIEDCNLVHLENFCKKVAVFLQVSIPNTTKRRMQYGFNCL